jgi:hypothetical protein
MNGGALRKIQVLILRLILDSGIPAELRGTMQAVPEGEPHGFHGEEAFMAILRQYNQIDVEPESDQAPTRSSEPENPG